jgi:hypothetical protein
MIGSWEIEELCEPQQLFAFSRAYLKSSIVLCTRINHLRRMPLYPDATVVLFLARHAVELFLKGAILARSPNEKLHHDLSRLKLTYDQLYSDSRFSWILPFTTEFPGMTPAQIAKAKKYAPLIEQVYRYPIDKAGVKWTGVFALEPLTFRKEMQAVERQLTSLMKRISKANEELEGTLR